MKEQIINQISSHFNAKTDDFIIEGLKRKGFEFDNPMELEKFI